MARDLIFTLYIESDSHNMRPESVDYCLDTIKEYCDEHDIDHMHRTDGSSLFPSPAWVKLDLMRQFFYGTDYDRMLYMDTDIVIEPGAPNIFDAFPKGNWMRRDTIVESHWGWAFEAFARVHFQRELKMTPYYNTGVMLLERSWVGEFLAIMRPPWVECNPGPYEQHHWNVVFRDMVSEIQDLPSAWNWLGIYRHELEREGTKWFTHYCGDTGKGFLKERIDSERESDVSA